MFVLLYNKSPQKNTEKIQGDYDEESSVSFCVFAYYVGLFFHETLGITFFIKIDINHKKLSTLCQEKKKKRR